MTTTQRLVQFCADAGTCPIMPGNPARAATPEEYVALILKGTFGSYAARIYTLRFLTRAVVYLVGENLRLWDALAAQDQSTKTQDGPSRRANVTTAGLQATVEPGAFLFTQGESGRAEAVHEPAPAYSFFLSVADDFAALAGDAKREPAVSAVDITCGDALAAGILLPLESRPDIAEPSCAPEGANTPADSSPGAHPFDFEGSAANVAAVVDDLVAPFIPNPDTAVS